MSTDIRPDDDLPGLEQFGPDDQERIGQTLGKLLAGFQARDVGALGDVYAADADWVNAFGTVRHGSAEILDHLRGLFADDAFDQGRPAGMPQVRLRRVTENAAVLSVHLRIVDQGLAAGGSIPVRDNFSVHVLQRQPGGEWRIVSEIYSDARTDQTYARR